MHLFLYICTYMHGICTWFGGSPKFANKANFNKNIQQNAIHLQYYNQWYSYVLNFFFFNFSEVNTLNLRMFRDQSTCIQSHILSNWEKWIGHLVSKDGDKRQTDNCLHNDRDSKTVVKSKETNWQLFGCSVKLLSGCFVQIQERI